MKTPLEPGKDLVLVVDDWRPEVPSDDRVKFRLARYEGKFLYKTNTEVPFGTSRFRLANGQEIWGRECYWAAFHPKGGLCGFADNGGSPCVLMHRHRAPHRFYG